MSHAADPDRALLHVVEPQQQADQRRLARARVAHHRDRLARRDREAHVAQHPVFVLVREPDVIELDGRELAPARDAATAGATHRRLAYRAA